MTNRREFIRTGAGATASIAGLPLLMNSGTAKLQKPVTKTQKKAPVVKDTDVVICGGGPAGFAAALASARSGASTTLIEMQGYLGGIWTAGLMNQIIDFANKDGIMKELMTALENNGISAFPYLVDPENMKIILEELCKDAGVHLRYYTRIVDADVVKNKVVSVLTVSNSGYEIWKAKVFVDATGNGDLAAFAGCKFHVGHPQTNEVQPMTLRAVVSGLDFNDMVNNYIAGNGVPAPEMKIAFRKEIEKAGVTPSYSVPSLSYIRDSYFALMANHEYNVSALDAEEMTKATISARKENNEIVAALRKRGGIWKNIRLVATGNQIGIREARRIEGRYYLTVEDMEKGATFEDGICTVTYFADIHSLNKEYGKGYSDGGIKVKPYQIPLRSLIAKDVDGLLMAGRCISGDFFAHASYRVTGNAVAMGEAAGMTAAYSALNNLPPHEVTYSSVFG